MLMAETTKDIQYQKAKIFFLTIDLLTYGAYQNNVLDSFLVNRQF